MNQRNPIPEIKSDSLGALIASLTPAEKRYFKLFAQNGAGSRKGYVNLFDNLNSKDESGSKKLSKHRSHLQRQLLRSLREFHSLPAVANNLRDTLDFVSIMTGKGLYRQAASMLQKTKRTAYRFEFYEQLPSILQLEMELLYKLSNDVDRIKPQFQVLQAELQVAHSLIAALVRYRNLGDRLFSIFAQEGRTVRFCELMQPFESEILEAEARLSEYDQHPRIVASMYYSIRSYYMMCGNEEQVLDYCKRSIELWERDPAMIKNNFIAYLTALNVQAIAYNNLNRCEEAMAVVKRVRSAATRFGIKETPQIAARVFDFSAFHELESCIRLGDDAEGLRILPDLERGLSDHLAELIPANIQSKRYRIALFHFLGGRHEESLRWINEILNEPQNTYRNDIQSSVRLLNLLVHYELGNFDLLPNYIRSYYRFLKSKSRLFKTEIIILQFIRRLPALIMPKDVREEYGRTHEALKLVQADDPLERSALAYFDVVKWLESRRPQKPVLQSR